MLLEPFDAEELGTDRLVRGQRGCSPLTPHNA
jgi:hypothetical protein